MTRLSDNTRVQSLRGPGRVKFVPFTAYAGIIPINGNGKRFETVRDMERIADDVEDALRLLQDSNTEDAKFDFAYPIAATPQFGDKTARVTIHGNADLLDNFTKTPLEEKTVVNVGEQQVGFWAQNAQKITTTELDEAVKELKSILETAIGLTIYKIDIAHTIYGSDGSTKPGHGFHFPR